MLENEPFYWKSLRFVIHASIEKMDIKGGIFMAMLSDVDDLRKRLQKLEDDTKFKIRQMEESFAVFRDVVIRMQKEKSELEKKNMLFESEKRMLAEEKKKILSAPLENAAVKISNRVVKPVKNGFNETVNLFHEALKEDEDINYIEVSGHEEKKTPEKVPLSEDSKGKVVQWFRQKHGIEEKDGGKNRKKQKMKKIVAS